MRVLGGVDLRDPEGRVVSRLLAQPKRFGLLAYLAVSGIAHRRDSLVALFWPDLDDARARLALRQAVHFVRDTLGAHAVSSGSGDQMALEPSLIRCDARECDRALDEGRWADALALYRGDLLVGFHLSEVSPEFDEWLERERRRLRARAAGAAWTLAAEAERTGNGVEATYRARQAVALQPDDEVGLRQLVSLLDRLGDRAGALRAYDEFTRRLRDEFAVEPAAETRSLIEAIRSREPATSSVTLPAPALAPATVATSRPRPTRRRRLAAALAGVLVLALAALLWTRRSPVAPPRTIAVGFIQNEGGDSTADAARILPGLLATSLTRVSGLSVVSESRIYELLAQSGSESPNRRSFADAARHAGADELIEGVLYRSAGGGLRLDLRRVDAARGTMRSAYSAEGVDAFEVADRVTARVAEGFDLTAPGTSLADAASGSLIARRLHEEGLRSYYRGEWRGAYRLFSAALAEDSAFAMAAYYAGRSIREFRIDSEFVLLKKAAQLARRAPERDRLLITYARHLFDYPVRAAVAESLVLRYPNDPEGHLAMANIRLAAGDFVGALPYARRVIAMDSPSLAGRTPLCRACEAYGMLLRAYASMGSDSFPAVERVAREWIERQPTSAVAWEMLATALAWRGRREEALQALNQTAQLQPLRTARVIFESGAIQGENYPEAERLLRDRLRFDQQDGEAFWWLMVTLRNQGRLREAHSLAERRLRILSPDSPAAAVLRVVVAQLLFELGQFHEAGRRFQVTGQVGPNEPADAGYAALQLSWHGVHAATAWAAAGDTQRLGPLADTIERVARLSASGLHWRIPHHVRGLLWQARGVPQRAAEEFRAAIFSPTRGYTRTNLELARAWISLGRPHEAIRILREVFGGDWDGHSYYLTRTEVHEWLARAFEAAGQPDSAAAHYRLVAQAWEKGDPPYRLRAQAARRKLQELER